MAEEFKNGLDPHAENAKALLQLDQITDKQRQFGKAMSFASIYGAGPRKLAIMLDEQGIVLPEGRTVKDLWAEFYELRPGIRALSWPEPRWNDPRWVPGLIEKRLKSRGFITTLWGRRLHPRQGYRALNAVIQGTATGDLVRAAAIQIHEWLAKEGMQSHMVNCIHDELLFCCTEEELPILASEIPKLMDAPYPYGGERRISEVVPIETDCQVSFTNWADKHDYVLENEHV